MDHEYTFSPEQLAEAHDLNCELAEELHIVDLHMKRDRGTLTEGERAELDAIEEEEAFDERLRALRAKWRANPEQFTKSEPTTLEQWAAQRNA